MFDRSPDERLSIWSKFRKELDQDLEPLTSLAKFWSQAPLISYNNKIDHYNPKSWPTPWEIIYENKYDDFTIAMMMGYSLRLTEKFKDEKIEVRSLVDHNKKQLYNLLYINEEDILNYDRYVPVKLHSIKDDLFLENQIEIVFPR